MAGCGCASGAQKKPSNRGGHLTRHCESRSQVQGSGCCFFNSDRIHRFIPHQAWPYLPILGTHSLSPDSVLCQARSRTHRRHFSRLTFGTTPYPDLQHCSCDIRQEPL
jgi:hypothetical protein